jgi:hypothetical protein
MLFAVALQVPPATWRQSHYAPINKGLAACNRAVPPLRWPHQDYATQSLGTDMSTERMYIFDQIKADLPDLNERLRVWNEKVNREHFRIPPAPLLEPKAAKVIKDYIYAKVGYSPLEEVYSLLDSLCDLYLDADPEQRAEIRDLMGQNRAVLDRMYSYIGRATNFLKETADPKWLRMGLAAASIEDSRVDYRDLLVALGDLYLAAAHVGIKPRPYFEAVGRISNPTRERPEPYPLHPYLSRLLLGRGSSTQDMLLKFERCQYFRQDVRPKLRK